MSEENNNRSEGEIKAEIESTKKRLEYLEKINATELELSLIHI